MRETREEPADGRDANVGGVIGTGAEGLHDARAVERSRDLERVRDKGLDLKYRKNTGLYLIDNEKR